VGPVWGLLQALTHAAAWTHAWACEAFAIEVKDVLVWAQHLRLTRCGDEVLTVFNRPWAR
jgi:hypothetical protein